MAEPQAVGLDPRAVAVALLPDRQVADPQTQRNFDMISKYVHAGLGSPEGVVKARIGATYHRHDGGAGTCFYVKESGVGNTGWVAK